MMNYFEWNDDGNLKFIVFQFGTVRFVPIENLGYVN